MGIGTQGTSRNADTLANGIVGVNKLPLLFDPKVLPCTLVFIWEYTLCAQCLSVYHVQKQLLTLENW